MIAIDFETFYDKKTGCSAATLGNYAYCMHEDFHVLLVAVVGEGIDYCGSPDKFDWTLLNGKKLLAHNASFDKAVLEYGVKTRPWFKGPCEPVSWHDTADLAAWCGSERALAKASAALLGVKHSKQIRTNMSGMTEAKAREKGMWNDFVKYGKKDAELCLRLWNQFAEQWPAKEQLLSRRNREEGERGVRIDRAMLIDSLNVLKTALWEAEQDIPWSWEDGRTPLAAKQLAKACRDHDIPAPSTTNKKDDECIEWMETYGAKFPWVAALHKWRSAYSLIKRLTAIQTRLRSDDTVAVDLMYFGAHTGRFTGAGGLNFANLAKGEICGVDVRKLLIARPGHSFFIADLAQIEPRCLAVVSGDMEFVQECAKSSPYEAHAKRFMGFAGKNLKKVDPAMYALAKARVLALGYGAGWQRFLMMVPTYIPDQEIMDQIFLAPVTSMEVEEFKDYLKVQKSIRAMQQLAGFEAADEKDRIRSVNAWKQVLSFRRSNTKITSLWSMFDEQLREAANGDHTLEVTYPSGRVKRYSEVHQIKGECSGVVTLGGERMPLYGGKLVENTIQAVARDVFVEGYLSVTDQGFHIPLHVYDEYVIEAPKGTPHDQLKELLTRQIDWMPELPIALDFVESDHYLK